MASGYADNPTKSERAANLHFNRGVELYQREDFRAAASSFGKAYELDPRPPTLYAWAQAERQADNCVKAVELYQKFLAGNPLPRDAEAAQQGIELCAAMTAPVPVVDAKPDVEPDEPVAEPGPRVVVSTASRSSPSRLRLFLRTDVEGKLSGAVAVPGLAVRIIDHWQVFAAGLIGANLGFEAGMRLSITTTRIRPVVTLAAPVFFVDGIRPGGRAALGLVLDVTSRIGIGLEVGAAYALSVPEKIEPMVLLGSLGLEINL